MLDARKSPLCMGFDPGGESWSVWAQFEDGKLTEVIHRLLINEKLKTFARQDHDRYLLSTGRGFAREPIGG